MKRILIADDSAPIRELLRDMLEDRFEISVAEDGQAAVRAIEAAPPDLVLLDIRMPGLDGFEVLRRVREQPGLANVRIAALTAFAMQGDAERALAAGFDAYITKPVDVKTLRAHVARLAAA